MVCTTVPKDSKKPFTDTRSIRFVVVLYSVFRTVFSSSGSLPAGLTIVDGASADCTGGVSHSETSKGAFWGSLSICETGATRLKCLLTNGDSSWSTERVRSAAVARRLLGNGICTVLSASQPDARCSCWSGVAYKEHGNSGSSTVVAIVLQRRLQR